MSWLNSKRAFFVLSLGVIVEVLAYPRYNLYLLAYPTFLFYLYGIHLLKNIRQAIILSFVITAIAGFWGYHWITFVISEMGGFSLPLALFIHGLFTLVCLPNLNSFIILGFLLRDRVNTLPIGLRPFVWTSLWVSLEFLWRPFKIFPEMVGNTQWSWLEISQLAALGGVGLISFFVVFPAACVFALMRTSERAWPLRLIAAWIAVALISHFWGGARIHSIESLPSTPLRVAMIQANIGNLDKAIAEKGNVGGISSVLDRYRALTRKAAEEKPDLILWPETAFPIAYPTNQFHSAHPLAEEYARRLQADAGEANVSLLIGGYERLQNQEFNSAILIGPQGSVQGSYKKNHLLIFGEYMPFSDWWPALKQLNPVMGDFGRGPGPYPLSWRRTEPNATIELGLSVCYEALIMPYMRALARNGAEVFINFTNDSWFGEGSAPEQHLMVAAFRTIENGIPLVRTTNTGISTVINAAGRPLFSGPLFQEAIIKGEVPLHKEPVPTLYRSVGELFSWLVCLFLGLILLFLFRPGKKSTPISA